MVLARTLMVQADAPIDPRLVARRFNAEEPGCFVFLVALPGGVSSLVGASPEIVIRRDGLAWCPAIPWPGRLDGLPIPCETRRSRGSCSTP